MVGCSLSLRRATTSSRRQHTDRLLVLSPVHTRIADEDRRQPNTPGVWQQRLDGSTPPLLLRQLALNRSHLEGRVSPRKAHLRHHFLPVPIRFRAWGHRVSDHLLCFWTTHSWC